MARITVEDCIDKFESRFELVLVASNRARKLHSGEEPTVEKDNDKNTVIALREIADESITIDDLKNSLIQEYQTQSIQNEEELSIENKDIEENSEIPNEELNSNEEDTTIESNLGNLEKDNLDEIEENHQPDNIIEMPDEDKN